MSDNKNDRGIFNVVKHFIETGEVSGVRLKGNTAKFRYNGLTIFIEKKSN